MDDALKEVGPCKATRWNEAGADTGYYGWGFEQRPSVFGFAVRRDGIATRCQVQEGAFAVLAFFDQGNQPCRRFRLDLRPRSGTTASFGPLSSTRNHSTPPTRTRRQHAVIADLMRAR